jgi:hypothetical protein
MSYQVTASTIRVRLVIIKLTSILEGFNNALEDGVHFLKAAKLLKDIIGNIVNNFFSG